MRIGLFFGGRCYARLYKTTINTGFTPSSHIHRFLVIYFGILGSFCEYLHLRLFVSIYFKCLLAVMAVKCSKISPEQRDRCAIVP